MKDIGLIELTKPSEVLIQRSLKMYQVQLYSQL